jgi:hypothetical protein
MRDTGLEQKLWPRDKQVSDGLVTILVAHRWCHEARAQRSHSNCGQLAATASRISHLASRVLRPQSCLTQLGFGARPSPALFSNTETEAMPPLTEEIRLLEGA